MGRTAVGLVPYFEGRVTFAPEARTRCALAVLQVTRPGWAEVPMDRLEVTDVWREALAIVDAVVAVAVSPDEQPRSRLRESGQTDRSGQP